MHWNYFIQENQPGRAVKVLAVRVLDGIVKRLAQQYTGSIIGTIKPSLSLAALRRAAISDSKNLPSGRVKSMDVVPFGRKDGESSLPHSVSF